METKNRLDFFADIKDRLLLIAAGLLSMATIVPMFINNIQRVFQMPMYIGYYVFVICYFILPVVFFLTYYGIVNNRYDLYDLKSKYSRLWIWVLVFCIIISSYIYSTRLIPTIIFTVLILFFLFYFSIDSWRTFNSARKKDDNKKIFFIEFNIVGGIILFLFVALYIASTQKIYKNIIQQDNVEKSRSAFDYYRYADNLDIITSQIDSLKNTCYKNATIAFFNNKSSTPLMGKKHTVYPEGMSPAIEADIKAEDKILNSIKLAKNPAAVKQLALSLPKNKSFDPLIQRLGRLEKSIGYSDTLVSNFDYIRDIEMGKVVRPNMDSAAYVYDLFKKSLYLRDYAQRIQAEGHDQTKERWVILMNQLQYKGLLWLLLLVVLSLCYWLDLTCDLINDQSWKDRLSLEVKQATQHLNEINISMSDKSRKKKDTEATLKTIEETQIKAEKKQQDIDGTSESIGPVKSFIYLLLLLIIPFFKHIEKSDIDLNKPFLNFNTESLIPDKSEPPVPAKTGGTDGTVEETEINLLLKNIDNNVDTIKTRMDTTLIYNKFDKVRRQINDHAKGTMRNAQTLDDFLEKYKDKPNKN